MGIKLILCTFAFIGTQLNAQNYEQQLKFVLNDSINKGNITDVLTDNQFKVYLHGEYVYQDIYFDNQQNSMYENDLCLRMRRRVINDTMITYSFQLKNEMTEHGSLRLEVEESELDFYVIRNDNKNFYINQVLDSIFINKDDLKRSEYLALLKNWMSLKLLSPISPFQALRSIYPEVFAQIQKSPLSAVYIGESKRLRGHVYLDNLETIPYNYQAISDRIPFFLENPKYNWLFEISFDHSIFSSIEQPTSGVREIRELELENKYFDPVISAEWIEKFENSASSRSDLQFNLNSKYKQLVIMFSSNSK